MNITFKKHPRNTGLYAVGHPYQNVDIKINKKCFGIIYAPNWQTEDRKWTIGIMIVETELDDNPNCTWKWIYFKQKFDEESHARQWIQEHIDKIMKRYDLRFE